MRPRQIEVLLAFLRTGATTVAAKQLGASQSTVSRTLAQAEALLQMPLFLRRKGQLLPTPQARALQPALQSLLGEWQALQRQAAQLQAGEKPRTLLRVHLPWAVAAHVLPRAAQALARTHPHAVLEVACGDDRQAQEAVLAHEADAAVLRLPAHHPRLQAQPLARAPLACLLPASHPLARRASLAAADLAGVGLVLPARSHRLRQAVDDYLKPARITPRVCAHYHCEDVAARLAAQGLGVALADGCLARWQTTPELACLPLRDAPVCTLGWIRTDEGPQDDAILRAFIGHLAAMMETDPCMPSIRSRTGQA
ncbi:LysR family transcriptional regulator [Orrella sp. JC864]|uniref:LysR family transcriptional regulator n=1 Tax=Orrella sp. JC864 TaxID=3120298 RepID=UPI0012BB7FDF